MRPPGRVNFTEFDSRFQTICCSRAGSPDSVPTPGSMRFSSVMPRATIAGRSDSTMESMSGIRSTGWTSSRRRPEPMSATFSRALMSLACALALASICASARCTVARSASPCCRVCVQPSIAFRGVRSSCDRVARKSSLARLAASACVRNACSRCNSSTRSCSVCLRSSISTSTTSHFSVRPPASWTGTPRARCQRYWPSDARRMRNSDS